MSNEAKALAIKEALENKSDWDLVSIHRDYCDDNNMYDDELYENDDSIFDELFEKPSDIINRIAFGEYNTSDKYWRFNGYGNIVTVSEYAVAEYVITNELIDWVIDNDKMEEYGIDIDEEGEEESEEEL
jgi:hypothetical protein